MADFKHPCLKPLGVHLKGKGDSTSKLLAKSANFLQNLVLIPQHSPFPTVPLSHKIRNIIKGRNLQRPHSRKVDFAMAHSHLTTCIAPSLNPWTVPLSCENLQRFQIVNQRRISVRRQCN
ncbi:MAG: hypothetical protein ACLTZI_06065 [[Eubacterium] siraeum]